jgi:hypothetical protein
VLLSFKTSARTAVILATLLLSGMPETLTAAEGRSWVADSADDAVWIIYGTPESDDVLLSIVCDKPTKTLTVWFAVEPAYSKNPETLPLEIFSEGGQVLLTGKGQRSEMDDAFSLEAKTPLTPEFEKLLTEAKTISVMVEDGTAEMPLDDAALKGAQEVANSCK